MSTIAAEHPRDGDDFPTRSPNRAPVPFRVTVVWTYDEGGERRSDVKPAEWRPTSFGYEQDGFRIRLIPDGRRYRWQLEVAQEGPYGGSEWLTVSYHRRLGTACARADEIARERRRRDGIAWRIAAGGLALLIALSAATVDESLATVVVATLGFALAVRFWLEAIALRILPGHYAPTDSWPPLERAALHVVGSMRRRAAARPTGGSTSVHTLPPDPEVTSEERDEPNQRHASPMHIC
jgi:hypothetical protein